MPTRQAGGAVLRDLFEHDDGGWLQDVPLLDRLVTEKLKAEAETIAAEGWKWIEVAVDFPYGHTNGLRELDGEPVDLTAEEQATIDALNAEYAKLEEEYAGRRRTAGRGRPAARRDRGGAVPPSTARPVVYDPADIARAGVFVSIDAEGRLSVDRGYVRPEDEAPQRRPESEVAATARPTDGTTTGTAARSAPSSPSAARQPNRTRRRTMRSSRCRIGSSPS